MEWNINPYVGVGNLKLGASQREIADLLGPPMRVTLAKDIPFLEPVDYEGLYTHDQMRTLGGSEYTASPPTVSYNGEKVVSFTCFDAQDSLNLDGIYFYRGVPEQAIIALTELSRCYVRSSGDYLTFLDLGISVLSEEVFDFSEPVTVFSKGRYDRFILDSLSTGDCQFVKGSVEDM